MTLTPQQRVALNAALLDLRASIQGMLRDGAERAGTVELDQSRMGRLSRIDAIQHQKMAQANLARQRIRLERVEAAIERFEDDPEEYGLCPDCDEDITFRRLQAAPDAIFCVDCASARQRRRRR
jgi:DnaK suppressor protein